MSALVWDQAGEHLYETGVSKAVLYPYSDGAYGTGVAWNGVTAVNENPSGAEANAFYADNIKYLNLLSTEEFEFTIEAYTYPDEFAECDGSIAVGTGVYIGQQPRKTFGFSYQTKVGNDEDNDDYGYKIHIVYGCLAAPSGKEYSTINDSPEPTTMSWDVTTTPVEVTGYKPTASIVIDSTTVDSTVLSSIEDLLYGTSSAEPSIPTPDTLIGLLS